jgi:hypothetical protein
MNHLHGCTALGIAHACLMILLSAATACAQLKYDPEIGDARMTGVVEVPGVGPADLHKRARLWMAQNFKSSDGNVLHDEGSDLIGTNNLLLPNTTRFGAIVKDRVLNHKLLIEIKDGRYRFTINNVVYSYTNWNTLNGTTFSQTVSMNDVYHRSHQKAEKRSDKGKEEKDKNKDLTEVDEALMELVKNLEQAMTGTAKSGSDDW